MQILVGKECEIRKVVQATLFHFNLQTNSLQAEGNPTISLLFFYKHKTLETDKLEPAMFENGTNIFAYGL